MLTPHKFNPHDTAYALNEESMLDWEGNMVSKNDRQQFLLANIEIDDETRLSSMVSAGESMCCDVVANTRFTPIDDDGDLLVNRMIEQRDHGMFQASMGSTNHTESIYLVSDDEEDENLDSPVDTVETSEAFTIGRW